MFIKIVLICIINYINCIINSLNFIIEFKFSKDFMNFRNNFCYLYSGSILSLSVKIKTLEHSRSQEEILTAKSQLVRILYMVQTLLVSF